MEHNKDWQKDEEALRIIREVIHDEDFDPRDREDFRQALEHLSDNGAYAKSTWMIQKGYRNWKVYKCKKKNRELIILKTKYQLKKF